MKIRINIKKTLYNTVGVYLICLLHFSILQAQEKCAVHLIVAYTGEAAKAAGGDSAMVKQIEAAVNDMNVAFMNSEINHWVRLLRTVRIDYPETGCFAEDLNAFYQGKNVVMEHTRWLRTVYHADMAALIINNDQFCGLPVSDQQIATAATAFCAVQYSCMIHNHSLSHMLGHLYGCSHAQFELDPPEKDAAVPYGHGLHWEYNEQTNFYTIMGVTDDQDCFGQSDYDCTLINYFSNPDVQYNGVPTGSKYANNARLINEQAPVLSDFFRIPANYMISDTVKTADLATALALDTLSTGSRYTGTDSSRIHFAAGKRIELLPGFSISDGACFSGTIDTTLSNCDDRKAKRKDTP